MNQAVSRRNFLKKAAYAAPVVIALGAMTAPISAHASVIYSQGTWNEGTVEEFTAGQHYDNVQKAIKDGFLSYDKKSGTYMTTDKFTETDFANPDNADLKALFDGLFNNA